MPTFRIDFIALVDGKPKVACASMLDAETIQDAIDQAQASLAPNQSDVTSIDIFMGNDKVETVGAGRDASRT